MATGKEWDTHFKTLPPQRLTELRGALETLKTDPLIQQEFRDTGLFLLSIYIAEVLPGEPERIVIRNLVPSPWKKG